MCQRQIISGEAVCGETMRRKHLYRISMPDLMRDVSRLLLGISSKCFVFNEVFTVVVIMKRTVWTNFEIKQYEET